MRTRLSLLLSVILLAFVLPGCDSAGGGGSGGGGGEAITLSSETNDEFDPIEYTFQYNRDDVTNGEVSVTFPPNSDQQSLDEALESIAAVSRSDIQSAEVIRVRFKRVTSGGGGSSAETSKVFSYLSQAEVRLGSGSGPLVGVSDPAPNPSNNRLVEMNLGPDASSVGDVLKAENPTPAVLTLDVGDPDQIADPFDEIEIVIDYAITVP